MEYLDPCIDVVIQQKVDTPPADENDEQDELATSMVMDMAPGRLSI